MSLAPRQSSDRDCEAANALRGICEFGLAGPLPSGRQEGRHFALSFFCPPRMTRAYDTARRPQKGFLKKNCGFE